MADDRSRDPLPRTRVVRRVNRGGRGTVKLLARHGDALVCVRYRRDLLNLFRYTTVELVVACAPLHPRSFRIAQFGLAIDFHEVDLLAAVRRAGARRHRSDGLWWLKGEAILELGLAGRIRAY